MLNCAVSGDDDSEDWVGSPDGTDVAGELCSLDDSWSYSEGEQSKGDVVAPRVSLTKQEIMRLYHLRQHLDKLRGNVEHHEQQVGKLR